jgi:hypothetical protein
MRLCSVNRSASSLPSGATSPNSLRTSATLCSGTIRAPGAHSPRGGGGVRTGEASGCWRRVWIVRQISRW